ncbi:MAG: DUF924 domain-containing protein [Gammaproteobacteria bacterium]|nr:DUF924 domain-containing protein [Gammaproteobacteria bacterium]
MGFWFEDAWTSPAAADRRGDFWYGAGETLDDLIRTRFAATLDAAARGELGAREATSEGALALVVLLDQFSRHCHRGTGRAFENDVRAVAVAKRAIAGGLDRALPPPGRIFLLHPFHHSETLAEQERYVGGVDALIDSVPPPWREFVDGFARYAAHHRDVIARFGRFPHRNEALGRVNTAAEDDYLAQTGGWPTGELAP